MSTFPGSPRVLKVGIVLLDPASSAITRVIVLQYNPDSLSRTLQIQAAGGTESERSEVLRLKAPPIETFRLEAELDATDQLEQPDEHPSAAESGIHPELAALESLLYPASGRLETIDALAGSGTLEITPVEAPLALLVWSRERVVPVRITDFSVTEEAFDPRLNPIRAKVTLGLRVLSVADLPHGHRGASLFMSYLKRKERLAQRSPARTLGALGIESIS
jgi:hypothetical protein